MLFIVLNTSENQISGKAPFLNANPVVYIFVVLAVVFFLYQFIGGVIQYLAVGIDFSSTTGKLAATRIIITFSQFAFILAPAIFFSLLQGDKIKDTFRLKPPKPSVFVLSVIGIFTVQPFIQLYMYFQNKIIFSLPFANEFLKSMKELFDSLEASTLRLVTAYSVSEFLVIVFVIAITPAICEEFLFRGFVLSNFEKKSKEAAAIFFSGLLFAMFHFHPFNLIPLTLLGIFLSFIAYHSGSILTAIVCHFINNFISALAVFLYGKDEFISKDIPADEVSQVVTMGIVSLVLFALVVFAILKLSATRKVNRLQIIE